MEKAGLISYPQCFEKAAEKKEHNIKLLSGNEAIAYAALAANIHLGSGYPGTPSTEILETFANLGGKAEWAPNEKIALEVGIGVAFAKGRALVTMKHVGLNVAADPLFTVAYTGVSGSLIIVVADDPGMASSQNEQDSRRYAIAAGLPLFEPADPQEAYDYFLEAIKVSERWGTAVLLRLTTRVSHTKAPVKVGNTLPLSQTPHFIRDIQSRVMIPAFAKPAHYRLQKRLLDIKDWNESSEINQVIYNSLDIGIITCGVASLYAFEAVPDASFLKIGMVYPPPEEKIKTFATKMRRCIVIEEGDPVIEETCRKIGIKVEGKPLLYQVGELNVWRVRNIINKISVPDPEPLSVRFPQFCLACPYRMVFKVLDELNCIVAGDIGCYTLGALPPYNAMDSCVCMGASIGVGLGLRHVLPPDQATKVVSVIGDSTFIHSGIPGIVEMVYNPPSTGHVVIILDNLTTAMTGHQEHPGTGRTLNGKFTHRVSIETLCQAIGISDVVIFEIKGDQKEEFKALLLQKLQSQKNCVIIVRKECILAARRRYLYTQG